MKRQRFVGVVLLVLARLATAQSPAATCPTPTNPNASCAAAPVMRIDTSQAAPRDAALPRSPTLGPAPARIFPANIPSTSVTPAPATVWVPNCVATAAEQQRYSTTAGVLPPLCGASTAPSRNLAAPMIQPTLPGATPPAPAPSVASLQPLSLAPDSVARRPPPEAREPGQIVAYWPTQEAAERALAAIERELRLKPFRQTRLGNLGGMIVEYHVGTHQAATELKKRLGALMPELATDFNTRYMALGKPRLYANVMIGLTDGEAGDRGKGARIGMVDSEVAAIPALARATIQRRAFVAEGTMPASPTHGTAVAALMVGSDGERNFSGVVPSAQLHVAAIMGTDGQHEFTNTATLIRALDWLLGESVNVINLSLGGPGDAIMAQAFARLVRHPSGVVVVAAAGNGGADAAPVYPAAYPGVIAVSAADNLGRAWPKSGRGAHIALAAPGVDVWVPDAADGRYVSGTSFAAALVSGSVALLQSRNTVTPRPVTRETLCGLAAPARQGAHDPALGCGVLQVGAINGENTQGGLAGR